MYFGIYQKAKGFTNYGIFSTTQSISHASLIGALEFFYHIFSSTLNHSVMLNNGLENFEGEKNNKNIARINLKALKEKLYLS